MPVRESIKDPWYRQIEDRFGYDFALEAGYFEETLPFEKSYQEALGITRLRAPEGAAQIVQFSGAFWPFHDGHLSVLQAAASILTGPLWVVVHVDHADYRNSKGAFDEGQFQKALRAVQKLEVDRRIATAIIHEDEVVPGCSRNFTRLYAELVQVNPNIDVWFLAGGDRANFALSFLLEGRCMIAGRESSPQFQKYAQHAQERIRFLNGENPLSSRNIRSLAHD